MKIKLFIDFDGTIYDTKKGREVMYEIFGKVGFSEEEITAAYQAECMNYKFNPYHLIKRLMLIREFNESLAKARIDHLIADAKNFLFYDSIHFIHSIDRRKYEVNLLSLGNIQFQTDKIDNSGVAKYFDNVYITDLQKWDYLKNVVGEFEKFILIDDRGDTISKVKKNFPKCLALEIDRRDQDKNDPVRSVGEFDNVKISNFKHAEMYLQ